MLIGDLEDNGIRKTAKPRPATSCRRRGTCHVEVDRQEQSTGKRRCDRRSTGAVFRSLQAERSQQVSMERVEVCGRRKATLREQPLSWAPWSTNARELLMRFGVPRRP